MFVFDSLDRQGNGDEAVTKRVFRKIALLIFACVLAVGTGGAEQPLSKDDVTLLLIGGATRGKMIALIEQRGIDFQMNPTLAKKFRDAGASDDVIEALQKAGDKLASGKPSAAAPLTGPQNSAAPNPTPPSTQQGQVTGEHPVRSTSSSAERKIAETLAGIPNRPDPNEHPLAPTFALVDLFGQKLDLADYKGKVVLLDFWATWCGPCRTEIPEFVELQDRYRDRGLQIIGISVDDGPKPVRKFYEQHKMNYPVAMCDSKTRRDYGGLSGVPTTLLIGREGRVYAKVVGALADVTSFEGTIKTLLAAQAGEKTVRLEQAVKSSPAESTVSSASSPKPKAPASVDLSDPRSDQIQKIIQEFAAKEKLFKQARDNYTYHQINKVETLDPDGNANGTYQQEWDILYDDNGKRIERVTYAPVDTLQGIQITAQDLDAFRSIQPFVFTTEELPEYDIKYLGHVKVDEIIAYVFSIRPKEIQKGRQYFQGVVWVDDRDLQIVKSEGKNVPELKTRKGENLFPRFTTYREQIDGKFWFPTFTMADDTLYFSGGPVHIKEIIRYTDYKQFKSSTKIRVLLELPGEQPKAPPKK